MTTTGRTRYFVIVSLLVLSVGLGSGLVAYYSGFPAGAAQSAPDELKLIPRNATLVAYADVHAVMVSEVRQHLLQILPANGQQGFESQTGIKIDTDVDRLVACLTVPEPAAQGGATLSPGPAAGQAPATTTAAGMALVRGRFNETRIEGLMRSHGAHVEDYKGVRLVVADTNAGPSGAGSLSLAFIEPGLVAAGSTRLIRGAVDLKGGGDNVTGNDELMNFVKGFGGDNAWVVGRFDALTAQAKMAPAMASQIPPITWFSASGHVDSGVTGTFRADARDEESANSLRDVLKGFVALAKLQTGSHPELKPMLDSLQLGGSGKSVTLAFDVTPQMFDLLATSVKGLRGGPLTRSK